jgi:hypothetical protein
VKRWREDILTIQEEMRRCLQSLEWHASNWESKADIETFEGERWEGSSAYAHEQADVRRRIATHFRNLWSTEQFKEFREFKPGDLDLEQNNEADPDTVEAEDSKDSNRLRADKDYDEEELEEEDASEGEGLIAGEEFENERDDTIYEDNDDDMEEGGEERMMEMLRELEDEREE